MANERINYSNTLRYTAIIVQPWFLHIGKIAVLKFKTIFHDVLNVIISLIAIILLNINSSE